MTAIRHTSILNGLVRFAVTVIPQIFYSAEQQVFADIASQHGIVMSFFNEPHETELVTVCSACLRASCWQELFVCDDHRHAPTEQRTRGELRAMDLEHSSYWHTDREMALL